MRDLLLPESWPSLIILIAATKIKIEVWKKSFFGKDEMENAWEWQERNRVKGEVGSKATEYHFETEVLAKERLPGSVLQHQRAGKPQVLVCVSLTVLFAMCLCALFGWKSRQFCKSYMNAIKVITFSLFFLFERAMSQSHFLQSKGKHLLATSL